MTEHTTKPSDCKRIGAVIERPLWIAVTRHIQTLREQSTEGVSLTEWLKAAIREKLERESELSKQ